MDSADEHQEQPEEMGADCTPHDGRIAAGEPSGRQEDFIGQTLSVWQKRAARKLSREDGREIAENMLGFFRVLQEWEHAERMAKQKAG